MNVTVVLRILGAQLLLSTLASFVAAAQIVGGSVSGESVDDTGTVVGQPVTSMRWRQLAPGHVGDNTVEGAVNVALHLNLAPWLHRQVRLYMLLAPSDDQQVLASWRPQGRLLPGTARGGDRVLVYQGPVRDPVLQETIVLNLTADGRHLEHALALHFSFAIEGAPR